MDNSNYGQAPQQRKVERYDLISNINDMIETLRAASGVPFSSNCAVDMIASLEELKNHLPASIAQSNDIVVRAQEIITTAREKSKKIIDDANRQYASKVNDHEITRGARDEADNILAAAENQADERKIGGQAGDRNLRGLRTQQGADERGKCKQADQHADDNRQKILEVLLELFSEVFD